jgi:hypothetical protein
MESKMTRRKTNTCKYLVEPSAHIFAWHEHRHACAAYGIKTVHPLIAAALAAPKTHNVVTTYADGTVKTFPTRNLASAENHAVGERRKVGRDLIDRMTGKPVRVVSVIVEEI